MQPQAPAASALSAPRTNSPVAETTAYTDVVEMQKMLLVVYVPLPVVLMMLVSEVRWRLQFSTRVTRRRGAIYQYPLMCDPLQWPILLCASPHSIRDITGSSSTEQRKAPVNDIRGTIHPPTCSRNHTQVFVLAFYTSSIP